MTSIFRVEERAKEPSIDCKQGACYLLASCLAFSSTLAVVGFSETSASFYRNDRRYIPEGKTLCGHLSVNLKSNRWSNVFNFMFWEAVEMMARDVCCVGHAALRAISVYFPKPANCHTWVRVVSRQPFAPAPPHAWTKLWRQPLRHRLIRHAWLNKCEVATCIINCRWKPKA
jgi:hypothetical protein